MGVGGDDVVIAVVAVVAAVVAVAVAAVVAVAVFQLQQQKTTSIAKIVLPLPSWLTVLCPRG